METEANVDEFDVDAFFANEVGAFVTALKDIETKVENGEEDPDAILNELTTAIHQSRVDCQRAEAKIGDETGVLHATQARFREAIAPWFDQSWFMDRAKQKPRGYPGDFEMLTAIYDLESKSTGFGHYMDLYFLQTDLARAVRARLDAVQKFLLREISRRTTAVSILNVASGPGREYSGAFKGTAQPIHLTCIDTDQSALEYLRDHIDPSAKDVFDLNCVAYNALKTTSPKTNHEKFGQPDIIYSVGLCDYIPDRFMVKILKGWRESVGPDGIVYVAFKDSQQYFASEYQWHVDWHFYQRTEDDCRRLFKEAGYDLGTLEMFRDETGIIMNFVSRMKTPGKTRVDQAESVAAPKFQRHVESGKSSPQVMDQEHSSVENS